MHELSYKSILFWGIAVFLMVKILWPDGTYKIQEVLDGNSLKLTNGVVIRLIGVANTQESQYELNALIGRKVELLPDSAFPFDPNRLRNQDGRTFYAYVLLPQLSYECINSTLLIKGFSDLDTGPYLTDSLTVFSHYSSGDRNRSVPQPPAPIDYGAEDDDFELPQFRLENKRKIMHWSVVSEQNICMLEEACDFNLPYTRSFAIHLASKSPGVFSIDQICNIFDYCYDKWRYVNDPSGQDYIASASETIFNSLVGDCDDFAVLLASCVIAIGGEATIVIGYGNTSAHAYAEVDISSFDLDDIKSTIESRYPFCDTEFNTRSDAARVWLNLDWQAQYPGGPYYNADRKVYYSYTNGAWSSH